MCPGEVCARIERQDSEAGQPGALAFAAKNLRLNDYPAPVDWASHSYLRPSVMVTHEPDRAL